MQKFQYNKIMFERMQMGCLQLLQILEIYWNLKTLLEILEISLNLMVLLEIFV